MCATERYCARLCVRQKVVSVGSSRWTVPWSHVKVPTRELGEKHEPKSEQCREVICYQITHLLIFDFTRPSDSNVVIASRRYMYMYLKYTNMHVRGCTYNLSR